MSEQAAFLHAIVTNPADDTARLVFADWLDEHEQPARALFIRAQLAHRDERTFCLSPVKVNQHSKRRCGKCAVCGAMDALRANLTAWPPDFPCAVCAYSHSWTRGKYDRRERRPRVYFERGFVGRIDTTCEQFVKPGFAKILFAAHPIECVQLVDRRPYDNIAWYDSGPGGTDRNCIPREILGRWNRLPKSQRRWTQIDRRWMHFASADDAQATLSDLCVSFGRAQAKLPPLPMTSEHSEAR